MFEQVMEQDGEGAVGFLTDAVEQLAKLPANLWRTDNEGFAGIAAALDALAVQVDCARVGLVAEAESRGVVDQSPSPSGTAWLMEHSFHLEPADASRIVKLTHLCALPKNAVMAAAVAGGTVTVRKAMTALRQLGHVEHDLAPGKREEALESLTVMAQTGYDANVVAVGRMLMALVGADGALEDNEAALKTMSSLRLSTLENGMTAISGHLDPEAAAVLTAALDPLSAPNPCDENGGRDPRPADRRRAEALIEICRRATAAGGEAPVTSKAQVVVLIDLERLTDAVRGAGTTLDGQVLSPGLVRKLACDADIIPIVLGSEGQPLDVGRTKRLVTQHYSPRCGSATKVVPSRRVADPRDGVIRIMSDIGSTGDPPHLPTSPFSAPPTTHTCTNAISPPPSPRTASPGTPDDSRSRVILPNNPGEGQLCSLEASLRRVIEANLKRLTGFLPLEPACGPQGRGSAARDEAAASRCWTP